MLGVEKVLTFLASEWIADIKKNQVPSVLGGVDIFIPMHSFVQLCKCLLTTYQNNAPLVI